MTSGQRLKLSSGLSAVVTRRISEIDPKEWNDVFPPAAEDYYFFKSLDECATGQFSFYYTMIYDGKKPVGATSFFLMEYAVETTVQGPLRSLLTKVGRFFPFLMRIRTLMCGLPMGQGRIGFRDNPDKVLAAVLKVMEQIAGQERVALLIFKDFDDSYRELLAGLGPLGFCRIEGLPSTEMPLKFDSFEEYLKTLSYASRYDLRRKFRRLDGKARIEFEETDRLEGPLLDAAHELYLQTVHRHELGFEIVPKEFFARIGTNMAGRARFFFWRIDGRLEAFAFALLLGDRFVDYYVGFDYDKAEEHHLFFLRFRDLLQWCFRHKMRVYEMGQTSYEPKRRLGFGLIPVHLYLKHRGGLANRFVKYFAQGLHFDRFDPALRKMKEKLHVKK